MKNQPNGIRMSEADKVLTAADYRTEVSFMNVKDYMKLSYDYVIRQVTDESGTYFHATVLELDGCQSTGETFNEAYEGLLEAMEGWIETILQNNFPIPMPFISSRNEEKTRKSLNLCNRLLHKLRGAIIRS